MTEAARAAKVTHGLLHQYGAVGARFGPGGIDVVLPANPHRDATPDRASEAR